VRVSSLIVAEGDHFCSARSDPLTFQVTWASILVLCSSLENLNRKRFGPRVEKENGIAKGQDLLRAA
jgi:hypothetical protein